MHMGMNCPFSSSKQSAVQFKIKFVTMFINLKRVIFSVFQKQNFFLLTYYQNHNISLILTKVNPVYSNLIFTSWKYLFLTSRWPQTGRLVGFCLSRGVPGPKVTHQNTELHQDEDRDSPQLFVLFDLHSCSMFLHTYRWSWASNTLLEGLMTVSAHWLYTINLLENWRSRSLSMAASFGLNS